MIAEMFSKEEKNHISKQIKDISLTTVDKEMEQLMVIGEKASEKSERCRTGNNIVDYFTFLQRLETKGKYNANFFEFLANIETFKEKKFIQTMIQFYKEKKNKNGKMNNYKVLKEVYNICISAINVMRPLICMEMYTRFHSKKVLNFCVGWGGTAIAAAALQLDSYYGVEINTDLKEPHQQLISYLKTKSTTKVTIHSGDATTFDYSTIEYDTVFTSPPYYFIQRYANNTQYTSKEDMNERFYKPVFTNTYKHLKPGGHYIINVCKEVYDNVLKDMFGEAHISFPIKKSKRQNNYQEIAYVWVKSITPFNI